jgi:hypothetical protein
MGSFNDSSTTLALDDPKAEGEDGVCSLHIGERLCKLEQLFEKFVCRKFSMPTSSASTEKQRSFTASPPSDETSSKVFSLPEISSDAQSMSSVGDGIVSPKFSVCCLLC